MLSSLHLSRYSTAQNKAKRNPEANGYALVLVSFIQHIGSTVPAGRGQEKKGKKKGKKRQSFLYRTCARRSVLKIGFTLLVPVYVILCSTGILFSYGTSEGHRYPTTPCFCHLPGSIQQARQAQKHGSTWGLTASTGNPTLKCALLPRR